MGTLFIPLAMVYMGKSLQAPFVGHRLCAVRVFLRLILGSSHRLELEQDRWGEDGSLHRRGGIFSVLGK